MIISLDMQNMRGSEDADFYEQLVSNHRCMLRVKYEGKAFIIDCQPSSSIVRNCSYMSLQFNQSDDQSPAPAQQKIEDIEKQLKNLMILVNKEMSPMLFISTDMKKF